MKLGGTAADPTRYLEVVDEVFNEECISPLAEIQLGGVPTTLLTESGRAVRMALHPPEHEDLKSSLLYAPLTDKEFFSILGPDDPYVRPFKPVRTWAKYMGIWQTGRLIRPADDKPTFTKNLTATDEQRQQMEEHRRRVLKPFEFQVERGLPNLHPTPLLIDGHKQQLRIATSDYFARHKRAWVDVVAPLLWQLVHRPNSQDFLVLEAKETHDPYVGPGGYVQFKGCAGRTDPFGRHWLYADSKSAMAKNLAGEELGTWHAAAAYYLGWRSDPRIGNDHGVFYIDNLVQVAMLAEMAIDTLILLHDLKPWNYLRIKLSPYVGGSSIDLMTTFGEKARKEYWVDD